MTNRPRKKGTHGENLLVDWLRRWWPAAERRAGRGIRDAGDAAGTPYIHSAKFCESWPVHLWLADLEKMRANADGALGWISAKRSRQPFVHIVPHDVMTHLMDSAYGSPAPRTEGEPTS